MRLLLLIVITTLYLAFPPPAQSTLARRYESPAPKSNMINKRVEDGKCVCVDDEEDCEGKEKKCDWSYKGDTGPKCWPEYYSFCGGLRQSPIKLYNKTLKTTWKPFQFSNYDVKPTSVKINNTGDTVKVTLNMSNTPYVSGGNLDGEYEFEQLHFHWGSNNSVGSEHSIQQKRYPCEVHLLHYKKSYKDLETATKYEDGLAVLGVFFTITKQDNTALAELISKLASVTQPCQEDTISSLPLSTFLPKNRNNFYRYQGSLTTPPCNEAVVWTVFSDTLNISATQMAAFRKLKDAHGHPIVNNFRPLQPLGDRSLYFVYLP